MSGALVSVLAAAWVVALLPATLASADTVEIADDDHDFPVEVTNATLAGNTVSGTVVNRGKDELQAIRLLVDIAFIWADEATPGAVSPGRALVFTVAGPLPPQGKLGFELRPEPPLEQRTDGRYRPRVRVVGYETKTVGKAGGD